MNKKRKSKKLLYAEEHLSCVNYVNSPQTGFRYEEIPAGTYFQKDSITQNYILMFLEGSCFIGSGFYPQRVFKAEEMVLIPKSSVFEGRALETLKVLVFHFHVPLNSCDTVTFEIYSRYCLRIEYDFSPLPFREPLTQFVQQMIHYLKSGIKCAHLFEIKHKEFFLLLRGFYTREQVSYLLYPILGKVLSFKDFILSNYVKAGSIENLISMSHLSKSSFYDKFKSDFGMTAKQWMLQQQMNIVRAKACEPQVTIKDLMDVIGYSSPTHFNRFCRTYLECTPGELLKISRE